MTACFATNINHGLQLELELADEGLKFYFQVLFPICNLRLKLQKPPAPVALEGRLCLSAKPHEVKRSLVWLNLPSLEKPGKTQGETATTTLQQ